MKREKLRAVLIAGRDAARPKQTRPATEKIEMMPMRPDESAITDEQIKYMVDRFLGWKLPESFNPDAGISFKKTFNEHTAHPMKHEPVGTNLFDATQANAMVRYMVEGLPASTEPADNSLTDPSTMGFPE